MTTPRKTILTVQNSLTFVQTPYAQIHKMIYHALSYQVPEADLLRRKGRVPHWWDGRKSLYNRKINAFPTGLLPLVLKSIPKEHLSVFDDRAKVATTGKYENPRLKDFEPYDFQEGAINAFLQKKRGIIQIATGGGKTEVAIAITKLLNVPTLWLTHRVFLQHQTARRYIKRWPEIKDRIGFIGNGQFNFSYVTFSTVQTLHRAIRKHPVVVQELQNIRLLIVDEAHHMGAMQFHETATACNGACFRLGLSATPFMRNDSEEDMMLLGCAGPVIYKTSSSELIRRGILARPYFKFFEIKPGKTMPRKFKSWSQVHQWGIVNHEERNARIASATKNLVEKKYKPLVIVRELDHADNLLKAFRADGIKAKVISGKNEQGEREKGLKDLSEGRCQAIICTNIFDEGIDVQDINAVVLASGMKSPPALLQRTGRAIRRKEEDNHAVIIDFIDSHHPVLHQHSMQRLELVRNEPEFKFL